MVVGNVVAGGGGKTPTVAAIVNHLREQGLRPGVLRPVGERSRFVVTVEENVAEVLAQRLRPRGPGEVRNLQTRAHFGSSHLAHLTATIVSNIRAVRHSLT